MSDIDTKLNEGLELHKMPVEQFAALAALYNIPKASKGKLYESFRGGKPLDSATATKLWKLWERVLDLIERAKPFPLALNDAESIKLLLDILGEGVDLEVAINVEPKVRTQVLQKQ